MRKREQRDSSTSSSSSPGRTPLASWSTCSMPEDVFRDSAARGAPRVERLPETPDPGLLHLLLPKFLTAKARALAGERGRAARWIALGVFGVLFWAFIFGVVF